MICKCVNVDVPVIRGRNIIIQSSKSHIQNSEKLTHSPTRIAIHCYGPWIYLWKGKSCGLYSPVKVTSAKLAAKCTTMAGLLAGWNYCLLCYCISFTLTSSSLPHHRCDKAASHLLTPTNTVRASHQGHTRSLNVCAISTTLAPCLLLGTAICTDNNSHYNSKSKSVGV